MTTPAAASVKVNTHHNNSRNSYYADDDEVSVVPMAVAALPPKILWSCVARNDVILAEAGEDYFEGVVVETAKGLMKRKATAGFEFHQVRRRPAADMMKWSQRQRQSLTGGRRSSNSTNNHDDNIFRESSIRGCKFHVYEHDTENVECLIVWVFAAVYDATVVEQKQVQSFLEKICALTEIMRDGDENWRRGHTLACQETFAPILQQRMEEVTYLGKMAMIEERLDLSRQIMNDNIELLLNQEELLRNQLLEKSTTMSEMANMFKKRTRKVRRMKMMQNAKHGLILGTAVTAGVAIIVIPPLIALL